MSLKKILLALFHHWKSNVVAGLVVGIVSLPLSMAFAIASGVKPEQGIYTAIIAGLVVGLLGGTHTQISGPTGAFVVILASITAQYGIAGLQIATLLAGLILILMGIFRIGQAIKFIPYPVIVGFTSGIGVIIFVGQWKDFFGLPLTLPIHMPFYERLIMLLRAFPEVNYQTTSLSCLSLGLIIFTPKVIKSLPGPLIAMLVATLITYGCDLSNIPTIGSVFGSIPSSWPAFKFPSFHAADFTTLLGPALTIALLGAIESLLSAAAADSIMGTKHKPNKELIGQGIANMLAPFWGGFASTGAIARTITSIRHGGSTPLAAIVNALFLILVLVLLAPYAVHIPFCALAAILFVVAFNMSDIPHFTHIIRHAPWYDVCVLVITFLLTIFVDLVVAVSVGVIGALLFFCVRLYQTTDLRQEFFKNLKTKNFQKVTQKPLENGILYTIDGPFFFGVAEAMEHALSITHTDPKYVVFCLKKIPFIDITGVETFSKVIAHYTGRNIKVFLCEATPNVHHKLTRAGVLHMVESAKIFKSVKDVLAEAEGMR
ncbi:MAG: SulP family inorganic anion transporter [Alphaproteobacteria bacterium]